jgi:hypothetical protein
MRSQNPTDFDLLIVFVVSRDWQVKRDIKLLELISQRGLDFNYIFFSEDEFTLGNAHKLLKKLGLNYLSFPRKLKTNTPIWHSSIYSEEYKSAQGDFSNLIESLKIHKYQRVLVFSDGIGGSVSGLPTQVLCECLNHKSLTVVQIQHGFLPLSKVGLLRTMFNLTYCKNNPKSKVFSLVHDNYSKFYALSRGAKLKQTLKVGNLNLLAIPNSKNCFVLQESSIPVEIILFTNGSFRSKFSSDNVKFRNLIDQLLEFLPIDVNLIIKPKSGEVLNLYSFLGDLITHGRVEIQSEDFSIEDVKQNQIIFCSKESNLILEAGLLSLRLGHYEMNKKATTRIIKYLGGLESTSIFSNGYIDKNNILKLMERDISNSLKSSLHSERLSNEWESVQKGFLIAFDKLAQVENLNELPVN